MNSGIARQAASVITGLPFVATGADNLPLVSPETFVVVPLERREQRGHGQRGGARREPRAFDVRKGITIVEGRAFRSGAREVVVGEAFASRFPNSGVGQTHQVRRADWTVVGQFAAERLVVRVGDLGRERADDAGLPGRDLPERDVPDEGPGLLRRHQADAGGGLPAAGRRVPGARASTPTSPPCWRRSSSSSRSSSRPSWRSARCSAR